MLYEIMAVNDDKGTHLNWILASAERHNLKALEEEFLIYHDNIKMNIAYTNINFKRTQRFIHWLIVSKGFRKPEINFLLCEDFD